MGWGDEVIVTSIVKKAKLKHPDKPICVGDGNNAFWSEVFENNPKISRKITKDTIWVRNIKGNRPYIDYPKTTREKQAWNFSYRVEPGELFFSPSELRHKETDFVYIEPNIKGSYGNNKDWGFDKWQALVNALPDVKFVQGKGRKLNNALQVDTRSFRDACALLSRAFLFVGTDGGLHHAAAALGVPAVVLWSGLSPPKVLGYDSHINICKSDYFCGSVTPCLHCKQGMEKITVEEVIGAVNNFVNRVKGQAETV